MDIAEAVACVRRAIAEHPPAVATDRFELACPGADEDGVVVEVAAFGANEVEDVRRQTVRVENATAVELYDLVSAAAEWLHEQPRVAGSSMFQPIEVVRMELLGEGLGRAQVRRALRDRDEWAGIVGAKLAAEHKQLHRLDGVLDGADQRRFAHWWAAATTTGEAPLALVGDIAANGSDALVSYCVPFVEELLESWRSMPPHVRAVRTAPLATFRALAPRLAARGDDDDRARDLHEQLAEALEDATS